MPFVTSGKISKKDIAKLNYIAMVHGGELPEGLNSLLATKKYTGIKLAFDTIKPTHNLPEPFINNPGYVSPSTKAALIALQISREMEKNPIFNAGKGSKLQQDGVARVSASFMESTRRKFSSVTNVEEILHPSELAYALQSQNFSILDGMGAAMLAQKLGIKTSNLMTPASKQQWQEQKNQETSGNQTKLGHGTIGSLAIDSEGNLAAVTSTGGVGNETAGRIGDTPSVAGNYCSEGVAISCTGFGEQIVNQAFAARVVIRTEDGLSLSESMEKSINEASYRGYSLSAIGLKFDVRDSQATWAASSTNDSFAWAIQTASKNFSFLDYA